MSFQTFPVFRVIRTYCYSRMRTRQLCTARKNRPEACLTMAESHQAPAAQTADLKVLVVDDHCLLSETLAAALTVDQAFAVDTVESVDAAQARIAEHGRYDAVLLDYDVPGMDALAGLRRLVAENDGAVALFSGVANWMVVERAMDAGASGFIPKTLPLKTLGHAIRFIADGEVYLPADYLRRASRGDDGGFGLKPREMRVLGFLCEGLQNKEIGRELSIEETIVKMDVKSICRKLGARNRTQAVIEARKHGVF